MGGGEGVWSWGEREIMCLSLHCHHQNDYIILLSVALGIVPLGVASGIVPLSVALGIVPLGEALGIVPLSVALGTR